MRNLILGLVIAGVFASCYNNKKPIGQLDNAPVEDSATDNFEYVADTMPAHPEADGLFDDFIYSFMRDSTLQYDRIKFPLSCKVDGKESVINKESWRYDSVYSSQSESTLIRDGRNGVERTCDSLSSKATVEIVNLKQERVKLYHFCREGKHWMLNSIDEHYFNHDNNHGFFSFYSKFANDEQFQLEHVHDPFYFKTYDGDNFQEIEGWVSADLWTDYRTYLPNEQLMNIIYDDKRPVSAYRSFLIGSPSSGMECTLIFKRTSGRWELVRMEN